MYFLLDHHFTWRYFKFFMHSDQLQALGFFGKTMYSISFYNNWFDFINHFCNSFFNPDPVTEAPTCCLQTQKHLDGLNSKNVEVKLTNLTKAYGVLHISQSSAVNLPNILLHSRDHFYVFHFSTISKVWYSLCFVWNCDKS